MSNVKSQPKSTGQLSGKYYRTRSLSQNLQQIFHPNRQSHSRSINNLSIIGAGQAAVIPTSKTMSNFPQSTSPRSLLTPLLLPQSPRIHIDTPISAPLFPTYQFNPMSSYAYPNFVYPSKPFGSPTKLKGFQLGSYRKKRYQRSISADVPAVESSVQLKNFNQGSFEERRRSEKFMINDVLRENDELLRRFSESKEDDLPPNSLTLFQNAFKSKFGSIFKHKKKYKINDSKESDQSSINRCDSSQSLPTLISDEKRLMKKQKKDIKQLRKMEKLKSLNLNPPQMIGGSFDNLLLINRVHKKKSAVGSYDTYHGRPLMSQTSRLKVLYKYRKPSESDDATTLSFDYDSGEVSDHSSIERSSSEEESSSYSDLTNKSSSRDCKIHSSVSIHSMPHYRKSRRAGKPTTPTLPSPLSSNQQFGYYRNPPPQSQSMMNNFKHTSYIPHQISAPTILQQSKFPSTNNSQAAAGHCQAIKAFFTQHTTSQADDPPLVSLPEQKLKRCQSNNTKTNKLSISSLKISFLS